MNTLAMSDQLGDLELQLKWTRGVIRTCTFLSNAKDCATPPVPEDVVGLLQILDEKLAQIEQGLHEAGERMETQMETRRKTSDRLAPGEHVQMYTLCDPDGARSVDVFDAEGGILSPSLQEAVAIFKRYWPKRDADHCHVIREIFVNCGPLEKYLQKAPADTFVADSNAARTVRSKRNRSQRRKAAGRAVAV